MTLSRPIPQIAQHNAPYFNGAARDVFLLQRCPQCGNRMYYPRVACTRCGTTEPLQWVPSEGVGTLYSFAIVHRPQSKAFLNEIPILLIAVHLDDGPMMISSMMSSAPQDLRIGMRVKAIMEHLPQGIAIPRFVPLPVHTVDNHAVKDQESMMERASSHARPTLIPED